MQAKILDQPFSYESSTLYEKAKCLSYLSGAISIVISSGLEVPKGIRKLKVSEACGLAETLNGLPLYSGE